MIKTMIVTFFAAATVFAGEVNQRGVLVNSGPLVAESGKCYTHVIYPARYKYEKIKVMTKEASNRFEHVPAKYAYAVEKRMVQEGREEMRVIPATYKTVQEKVMTRQSATRIVSVPAKYGYRKVRVLVKDSETQWKKGESLVSGEPGDNVVCAEDKPAVYKIVKQKILIEPARTVKQVIPEEWGYVSKKVIDEPAKLERMKIAPVYKNVRVKVLVEDAREVEIDIPAEYGYVNKKVQTRQSFTRWEEVVCASNINSLMILKLQKGLNQKGYNLNEDGVWGSETRRAVSDYQRRTGHPKAYLTKGVLNSLGIDF